MLRKDTAQVFIPGSPEVPYRPAQTTCPADVPPTPGGSGGGHWATICTTISVIVGWDYGPPRFDNPGPFPKPIYSNQLKCRTEWVPG